MTEIPDHLRQRAEEARARQGIPANHAEGIDDEIAEISGEMHAAIGMVVDVLQRTMDELIAKGVPTAVAKFTKACVDALVAEDFTREEAVEIVARSPFTMPSPNR